MHIFLGMVQTIWSVFMVLMGMAFSTGMILNSEGLSLFAPFFLIFFLLAAGAEILSGWHAFFYAASRRIKQLRKHMLWLFVSMMAHIGAYYFAVVRGDYTAAYLPFAVFIMAVTLLVEGIAHAIALRKEYQESMRQERAEETERQKTEEKA